MSPVYSSPQGGSVVSGSASISQSGSSTTINQISKQVIIDWNSFGIGPNELVQFLQPSSVAIALNRVTGVSPSLIYGILQANGRIFLINPNGILFGAGSEVDVGGLVASTLDISNSDFLSGNYTFNEAPGTSGFVVNEGTITTTEGGTVALYGATVENEGTIDAPAGMIELEAEPSVVLSLDDSGLVNVDIEKGSPIYRRILPAGTGDASGGDTTESSGRRNGGAMWPADGSSGKSKRGFDGHSRNSGAESGGWLRFQNTGAAAALNAAVNRNGLIAATSSLSSGTEVVLTGDPGLVVNDGTIEANGTSGVNGGTVLLDSTIGTALLPGSVIEANGEGENSNGGNIKVLSDGNTGFATGSSLESKGGTSGNGGNIEVSAEGEVSVNGTVDTSAQNGSMGNFLLDPSSLVIEDAAAGSDTQDSNLPTITYATLDTVDNELSAGSLEAAASNITLQASSSITVANLAAAPIGGTLTLPTNVSLTMQTATGNITFANTANAIVTQGNGTITIDAGQQAGSLGSATVGTLTTNGENITVTSQGNLTVGTLTASGATVTLSSGLGAIVNGNGVTNVTAGELIMTSAEGIGTAAKSLKTAVSELQAYNSTTNGIYISNTGALTIDDFSIGRGTGVENDALGGAISITNAGNIDLPGNFTANTGGYSAGILALGGGSVTLTTTGGGNITACDGASCTGMAAAESDGGNITFTSNGSISLGINAYSDVATAFGSTNSGTITLTATGTVTLNDATNVESNTGAISVKGTSVSITNGSLVESAGSGNVTIQATSGTITEDTTSNVGSLSNGNLTFTATGNIALNDNSGLDSANYTLGNITVTSTGGTISTTSSNPVLSAGGSLSVSTAGAIGSSSTNPLTVQASTLSLKDTGAGAAMYILGEGSVTSLSVTTDNGPVGVTVLDGSLSFSGGVLAGTTSGSLTSFLFDDTGGNVTLNSTINAGTGAATLIASGYIANGGSALVTAGTLTMQAGTGIGWNGATPSAIPTSATNLTVTTTGNNTAQINVSDSSALTSLSVTTKNSTVAITASNVTGSVALAGGAAGSDDLNAQFTGSSLTNLLISNTGGNLVLTSANLVNMGSNAASTGTLTASGYIANGASNGSVTANTLTMTAATGIGWNGTTPSSIATSAANLTVTTTTLNTAQINIADSNSLAQLSVTTNNSPASITAANLSSTLIFQGGSGGSDLLNAVFSGSTLTTFLFDNTGGNIVVDGSDNVNMGTNAATTGTLTASGYIANGSTNGSISANTLTMTAATGIGYNGTTASSISTNAVNLTLTTTTANTAQINVADSTSLATLSVTTNNDSVGITASNITGTLTLVGGSGGSDLLNAVFSGSTLTTLLFDNTGGNIVVDGSDNVTAGTNAASATTLEVSGYIANGASTGSVTSNTLTLTATSYIGASGSSISTAVSTLNATSGSTGIYLSNAGPGNLTLGTVSASGANNNVSIANSAGNISVGTVSGGAVSLSTTAAAGTITDSSGSSMVTGTTSLTLNAPSGIGSSGQYLFAYAPSITATTATANTAPVYVSDSDYLSTLSLTVSNSTVAITSLGSGSVAFAGGGGGSDLLNAQFPNVPISKFVFDNTGGSIAFNAANTVYAGLGATVDLVASGSITTSSATATDVTAQQVALGASSGIGSSSDPIITVVNQLTAYNSTSNGIYLSNTGALTVDDYYFNQGFGIENAATGGAISLTNAGTIDVPFTLISNGTHCLGYECGLGDNEGVGFYAPGGGNITVTANGSTSNVVGGDSNYGEMAESDGGSVSITAGQDIVLGIGNSRLWADIVTFTGSGGISLNAGRNITLTGYTTLISNSGNINFTAAGVITSTLNNDVASSPTFVYSNQSSGTGTGNITLTGSSVSVDNVSTDGNISVTATSGSITDSSGGTANCASAGGNCDFVNNGTTGTLTLNAATYVGTSSDPIYTRTNGLAGSSGGSGFYVTNLGANTMTLGEITATGANNNITISSKGSYSLTGAESAAIVSLTTTAGSITATGAGDTITGTTSVTLSDTTGIGAAAQSIQVNTPSLSATDTTANTDAIYIADSGTSLTTLSITTKNGIVAVTAPNISGTLSLAGGNGGTDLFNAQFTGNAFGTLTFDNSGGNIVLNSANVVNLGASSSTVGTLTASGYIANNATSGSITANTLTLTAGSYIGTAALPISMNTSGLTATANNGGVYVTNTGSSELTLNGVSASGTNAVTVLDSGGTMNIGGAVTGGVVTLSAPTGIIFDTSGATVTGSTSVIMSASGGVGANGGAIGVATPSLTVSTTTANTASIYVSDSSALTTLLSVTTNNSSASISAANGSLTFTGGLGGSDILNAPFTNAGSELTTFTFDNTGGNIEFDGSDTVNLAGAGTVNLTASAAISDSSSANSTSVPAVTTGGTLNLIANSVGVVGAGAPGSWTNPPPASWTPLYTNIAKINTTITNNLVLDNSGSLTEGIVTVGGTAYVIANGTVVSGGIIAGNGIYLIATGSIVDGTNGTDVDYQGKTVDLVAGGYIGTSSDPVSVVLTGGGGLDAFAADGSIYISGASPLSGSSQGVYVSQGGTSDFSSLAQAAIATFENEDLPDGVSLIEASPFYTGAAFTSSLIGTDSYFEALSQDNPYQSNDYDTLSEILLEPVSGVMSPIEPILFEDWTGTKKKHRPQ